MLNSVDTLSVSDFVISSSDTTISEIDLALSHAHKSKLTFTTDVQQSIISGFIDDLLDTRWGAIIHDNNHCNPNG